MRFVHLLLAAFFGAAVPAAACEVADFPKNGLYYSADGTPETARRIETWAVRGVDQQALTALEGVVLDGYSPDGRFFLRSGAGNRDWLLIPPGTGNEAVLVRRLTQSVQAMTADFVSVYRKSVGADICAAIGAQEGYDNERNFVSSAEFILVHISPQDLKRNLTLNEIFHFQFDGTRAECIHSADIRDELGVSMTSRAYLGQSDIAVTTRGELVIAQGAADVVRILLPAPAYASLPDGRDPRAPENTIQVSSVEASLFHLGAERDLCLSFPAPVPTTRAATGLARLFDLVPWHQQAALRLARDGKWSPTISEFHFQQIANSRQNALVRVVWARPE